MNACKIIPLLAVAVVVLLLALPAHSQTGIIVNNADTVREESVRLDTGLSGVTGNVKLRIVLQYANTLRQTDLVAPPADLRALFTQVPARIVLQYANTKREERIAAPPADLRTLFGQVSARIVLQYANTMRQTALAAPPTELRTLLRPGRRPHHPAVRQHQPADGAGLSRRADQRHRPAADPGRAGADRGRRGQDHLDDRRVRHQ